MKNVLPFLLLLTFASVACDKSEGGKEQAPLPVTEAVKTGDWMVLYYNNGATVDVGLTFLKFSSDGSLAVTKDGTAFNGTWKEENSGGNNTLTLNITTSDTKLQKVNNTWRVTGVSEYFIDLKDATAGSKVTVQLMKH